MTKYNSRITEIDGIKFHSKLEANRYSELVLMQKAGEISDLQLQPKFEICPGIYWNGKKLRARFYIADFQYIEDGKLIIEDVKGFVTKEYSLKRQLFLYRYPKCIFREIKR